MKNLFNCIPYEEYLKLRSRLVEVEVMIKYRIVKRLQDRPLQSLNEAQEILRKAEHPFKFNEEQLKSIFEKDLTLGS